MTQAFLIIIALAGASYAFVTRQVKIGLGFLILAVSFALTFPKIVSGAWIDIFGALSLIMFLIGTIAIVWKKPVLKIEKSTETSVDNSEIDESETE